MITLKNDFPDSDTLLNTYFAILHTMGYPKKGLKFGRGPFKTIPIVPEYPDPFMPTYGWAYEPLSIMDGPNPGEEGLMVTDASLVLSGITRNIPTIGPVTIDLSGSIVVPEGWTYRAPSKPPWI